jgi:outer membrane lipoprotein carrier protein
MSNCKKIFSSIILLSGFWFSTANAQDASQDLTKLLQGLHTMQAAFVETVTDQSSAKTLQQTQGYMALQRPGKFRWEVTKPNPQIIIANGKRLWIYDVDLQQVTIRAFNKAAGQTPALLLTDSNPTLTNDFNVSNVPNPMQIANYRIFMLTPKNPDETFDKIKLSFINNYIHEMQLEDKLGHVTRIAFKEVHVDEPIPASSFIIKPAANVDVIDETQNKNTHA